jgi:hypothetical protein
MSENTPAESSESAAPEKPAKADKPPKLTGWRKWRRRLSIVLLTLVIVGGIVRALIGVLTPYVVRWTAHSAGYDIQYSSLDLSLLGGQAWLNDVRIKPRDGKDEDRILAAEYVRAHISPLDILRLHLKVYRAEADGATIDIVRLGDGSIPYFKNLLGSNPPVANAKPTDITFNSPAEVDAVRLNRVTVHVTDHTVSPAFAESISANVALSQIGFNDGKPATLEVNVGSTQLIDSLRILGQINAMERSVDSKIGFEVRGLRPDRAAPYLAALGIGANDRNVDVRGSVNAKLTTRADAPGVLAGTVSLDEVKLFAGRETVASLGKVSADVAALSPSQLHVKAVDISGGSLVLQRSPEGVRFAAFRPVSPTRSSTAPAAPASTSPTPTTPFVVKVDRVTIADMMAALEDFAVVPRTRVEFDVKKVEVLNLATTGGADDATTLTASLTAPKLVETITAKGDLKLHRAAPTASFEVVADGIRPDAITPYLRPIGLAHTFDRGTFKTSLDATVTTGGPEPRVDATLKTINLSDKAGALFDLTDVRVRGFRVEGNGAAIVVDEIAGTGPKLTVRRRQDGSIEVPGLRYKSLPPKSDEPEVIVVDDSDPQSATTAPTTQVAAAAPVRLPAILVGKLTWGGVNVRLENELGRGVVDAIQITDAGAELTDFVFDPRENVAPAKQGTLKAWLRSPGFIDSVDVNGSLVPTPGQVVAKLDLAGKGITLDRLTPYLASFGIEPLIQKGTVDGKVLFLMRQRAGDEALTLSSHVEDFALRDGGRELLSAKQLGYDWLLLAPGKLQVGNVWAIAPTLDVTVEKTGAITAAGVRYVPPTAVAAKPNGAAAPVDPFALVQSLGLITLDHLYLRDADVRITNQLGNEPVVTKLTSSAQLDNFAINAAADQTAYYWATLGIDDAVRSIKVAGTIAPKRESLTLRAEVRGEGITGKSLASYVPPAIALNLSDATLAVDADAMVAKNPAGGYAASLGVKGLDFREAGAADPLAALSSFEFVLDRLDVPAGVVAIRSIALDGLDAQARRGADGKIALPGITLTGVVAPIDATGGAQAEVDVDAVVAAAKQKWPLLSVDAIDLKIKRLQFTDQFRPEAAPVAVRDLTVKSRSPLKLLGEKPAESTPVALDIAGSVSPAVGQFNVGLVANAFVEKPTLAVDVSLAGINGAGIVSVVPEVKPFLDGSSLADGRFTAKLNAEAGVRRRGPVVIEFSRGIDLSFDLTDVAFRDGADSPILAGVAKVHGEQVKIDPMSGAVNARLVEVTDVKGFAYRDAAGIHVLGFTVKPPGAASDSTASTTGSAPAAANDSASAPTATVAADAGPEIRLNRVLVSGADLRFEDRMVEPIVEIPINQLDVDLRGLSSHVLTRDRPVRFNVNVGAGKVSLTKKGRGAKEGEFEDRPFFAQVTAFGEMAFAPQLRGRGVFAANGIELNAIRGVAAAYGAGLSDGTFDGRAELRSRDDGSMDVRTRLVLTDLVYSEPENGVIQRTLKLPTPVNAAIFLIKSPDGTITLPVNFNYRPSRNPLGDVIGAAIPPVAAQVAVGVASSPFKLLGMGGDQAAKDEVEDAPIVLKYPTGLTTFTPEMTDTLDRLAEEVKKDKGVSVTVSQRFGALDAQLARARANPDPAKAEAIAAQLRDRRAELIKERDAILASSRAEALGATETIQSAGAIERLRTLQKQIADVEEAFDWMYDLQRPGAETQADRRARAGVLAMMTQRKDLLERAMKRRLADPDAESRVQFATPKAEMADGDASELVIVVKRKVAQKK